MIARVKMGLTERETTYIAQGVLNRLAGGCFVFNIQREGFYCISKDSPSPVITDNDCCWSWPISTLDVLQDKGGIA